MSNIRNFTIIAHIDHGKSTLSDRLIELCNAISKRKMETRLLDTMDLEKEKGITIKAQTIRLIYNARNGQTYCLNLMDTPGHVDFSYEVGRCISACEGSLLLVDSTQGVEAQTLSNAYKAIEYDHVIIPVLNKIDMIASDIESCKTQIENVIGIDASNALQVSGKTGSGVHDLLEEIVQKIPPADISGKDKPLKALLIDSWFDKYRGVIILVRVYEGILNTEQALVSLSNNVSFKPDEVGHICIDRIQQKELLPGEIGYIISNIKQSDCKVGDTISHFNKSSDPLPGLKEIKPVVFCSIFAENGEVEKLKYILEKLKLNDGFTFQSCSSSALGMGFRCGFLGLLHLEIILERMKREFDCPIIPTASSVEYKMILKNQKELYINNPHDLQENWDYIEEPIAKAHIMAPSDYLGDIIQLTLEKRGVQRSMEYINEQRVILVYDLPLNEIIIDFYDRLKSLTSGYASFDYEIDRFERSDIVILSIMLNDEIIDSLSCFVHRNSALQIGRESCLKLKSLLSREMFDVKIQAKVGSKIICSERLSAFRKNVTAKLYGGDVTRKNKLLDKQKKGKKKMKDMGSVDITSSILVNMFKRS